MLRHLTVFLGNNRRRLVQSFYFLNVVEKCECLFRCMLLQDSKCHLGELKVTDFSNAYENPISKKLYNQQQHDVKIPPKLKLREKINDPMDQIKIAQMIEKRQQGYHYTRIQTRLLEVI